MRDGRFLQVSVMPPGMVHRLTVNLDQEWLDDIVSDHLKVGVTDPVGDLISVVFCLWSERWLTVVLEPVKKLSRTVTS